MLAIKNQVKFLNLVLTVIKAIDRIGSSQKSSHHASSVMHDQTCKKKNTKQCEMERIVLLRFIRKLFSNVLHYGNSSLCSSEAALHIIKHK